jgi:hypothetical protein
VRGLCWVNSSPVRSDDADFFAAHASKLYRDYSLTVTCGSGSPVTFSGVTSFTATASTETVTTAGGTFTGLTGDCVVTGSATLTSSGSTVSTSHGDFTINGGTGAATLSCPNPCLCNSAQRNRDTRKPRLVERLHCASRQCGLD